MRHSLRTAPESTPEAPQTTRRQSTAKGQASTANLSTGPATRPLPTASPKTVHLIDELRRPFLAFVVEHGTMLATRAALAPRFMRAFTAFVTDTEGSFVEFCRTVDPKIPADREGYKAHPSYQAADYLRRLVAQTASPKEQRPASERPVTPLVALARMVATVLPLIDVNGSIWRAFVKEMNWSERMAIRVQTLAAKEGGIRMAPRIVHQLRSAQVSRVA